jgi:hypothetical protein
MTVYCKRCGRLLKAAKSINLGYGPTCYRKKELNKSSLTFEEELKFLKVEIKMLKRIIRELTVNITDVNLIKSNIIKANNFIPSQKTPIVPIIKEASPPRINSGRGDMREVIQELKACFQNCNGDVRSILTPIQMDINFTGSSQSVKV